MRAVGLLEPAAVDLGDGDEVGVLLRLEVEDVALADQAVADEADADALVGAGDAAPARGGEQGRRPGGADEGAAVDGGGGGMIGGLPAALTIHAYWLMQGLGQSSPCGVSLPS